MRTQYLVLSLGLSAMLLAGCNEAPPPKPVLPQPIQPPPVVDLDVQKLMETAEKEFAPVDPPSFARPPAEKTED
jgi:hypothetical protein